MSDRSAALPIALLLAAALSACGATTGDSSTAAAPRQPGRAGLRHAPHLHLLGHDRPAPARPFKEENPHVDVKTATFDSDSEAAAKLVGGFQADVVEACADEINPLSEQNLLRPLDTKGMPGFDTLTFHDAPGVIDDKGPGVVRADLGGPAGADRQHRKGEARQPHSWKALFEPQYKGEVAIEGDEALTPIGEAALAMGIREADGNDCEGNRRSHRLPEGTQGPVPQLHRIGLGHDQPAQVG